MSVLRASVLRALVVPLLAGAIMAAAGGAAAFGLMATLNPPTRADKLTAELIGRLDGMNGSRVLVTAAGHRGLRGDCTAGRRGSQIRVGSSMRLLLVGTHVRPVTGTGQLQRLVGAAPSLAACPRFLANGLSGRLLSDRLTLLRTTRHHGRSVDVFAASSYSRLPFVQLVVNGETLVPTEIRFVSRRLVGHSQIVALTPRGTGSAPVSSCPDPGDGEDGDRCARGRAAESPAGGRLLSQTGRGGSRLTGCRPRRSRGCRGRASGSSTPAGSGRP
jgi:hypothetical protein